MGDFFLFSQPPLKFIENQAERGKEKRVKKEAIAKKGGGERDSNFQYLNKFKQFQITAKTDQQLIMKKLLSDHLLVKIPISSLFQFCEQII